MATLFYKNGSSKTVTPKDLKKGFQLNELYKMLNCEVIEIIPSTRRNGMIAVCDENGLLKDSLEYNENALIETGHYLVGNVLVCDELEIK